MTIEGTDIIKRLETLKTHIATIIDEIDSLIFTINITEGQQLIEKRGCLECEHWVDMRVDYDCNLDKCIKEE